MTELTYEFARTLYEDNATTHAFDHVLRVTRLAERIARNEHADLSIVRTASLLHDIARSEPDHHMAGASQARSLLVDAPSCFVEAVVHCIESHSFDLPPQPRSIEAKCLCDADKLDAIGAIGVARTFAVAGIYDSRLWVSTLDELRLKIGEGKRAYRRQWGKTKDYTPSHELICKLEDLGSGMYTVTARRIAAERHRFMVAFFHRLDEEALGKA